MELMETIRVNDDMELLFCVFEHHVAQFFRVHPTSGPQMVHQMVFKERFNIKEKPKVNNLMFRTSEDGRS